MAEITINLDNSLYTNSFSENERIHGKAFARAKQLIDSQIRVAEEKYGNEPNESNFLRQYNTISILGERGVGKTSFLMSLTEEYKTKKVVVKMSFATTIDQLKKCKEAAKANKAIYVSNDKIEEV